MKVTDEMVEKMSALLEPGTASTVRQLLQAALADVPEPNTDPPPYPGQSWAGLAGERSAEAMLAQERIAKLEAQLAQAHKTELHLRAHRAPLRRIAELEALLDAGFRELAECEAQRVSLEAQLEGVREWLRSEAIEASAFDRLHAMIDDGKVSP